MSDASSLSVSNEGWEAVLVEILESEERGQQLPIADWLAKYPLHSSSLTAFFADRSALDGFLSRPVLPPGEIVSYFGDYELLSEIARGGMGVIYRARQANLQREVALKMVLGGRLTGPGDLERFRREAQAVSQLDHPGIVPLYEIGEHQGQHYFTMKLIAGGSLAGRVGQGRLPIESVVKLITTVANAVHYAHQRGILHRDLKPANILLENADTFTPLVADFGLSRPLDGSPDPTRTGIILGTPTYMAPEQARAEKQLTTGVDVYSLGAILYELLTGQPPFRGASIAETLRMLEHDNPIPPRRLNAKVDRDLETITLKCLAKLPQERYTSAEALASDLDRWSVGKPIEARPVTAFEHVAKWTRRKPAVAALMAALAASIVLGLCGMAYQLQQTRTAQQDATARAEKESLERERAQIAERKVEAQRDRAEQSLYFNRTASALRYWEDGNLVKAESLLKTAPEQYRNWEWQHLQKLLHPEESSIPGYGFHLSTNQKRMFVLHWQCADLWDVKAWKELKRIEWGKDQRFVPSPDGTRYALFSSKSDNTPTQRSHSLTIHDTETGRIIWKNDAFPLQAFEICTAVFSPDNSLIAVCGSQLNCTQGGYAGSTTVVIDGDTGDAKYTLKQGGIAAAFSPDGKMLAAYEEKMELYRGNQKPPDGIPIEDGVIPCSWHWPDGKNLRYGDQLNRRESWINLLDPATGKSLGKLTHPEGYGVAQQFQWSPDSKLMFSLQRGVTDVYDVANRKHKTKLLGHKDAAYCIGFTANPNIVITGGGDRSIKEWNLKEGKSTREWKGHQQYVGSVAVIDGGRTLISGSGDHTIRRWRFHQSHGMVDIPNFNEIEPSNFANGMSAFGAFHWANGTSRDGKKSVVLDQYIGGGQIIQAMFGNEPSTNGYELSLIDTATQRPLKRFKSVWQSDRMAHNYMSIRISPDDHYAAACYNSQPVILDLKTGAEHFLPFRSGDSIAFSPDSKTLATVHGLAEVVYSPSQPVKGIAKYTAPPPEIVPVPIEVLTTKPELPTAPAELPLPPPQLPGFRQNPSFLRLWDVQTRKETAFVVLEDFACEGLNYSADGTRIVVWGYGPYVKTGDSFNNTKELRVIDVPNRKVLCTLAGSHLNHREAVFNADGSRVVAASWDGNVYVWNTEIGDLVHTLRGHQGYVWSAVFTPDGKRIISSGNDAMLKVWDAATGEDVISFPNEGGDFRLQFDADGQLRGHGSYVHRHWQSLPRE